MSNIFSENVVRYLLFLYNPSCVSLICSNIFNLFLPVLQSVKAYDASINKNLYLCGSLSGIFRCKDFIAYSHIFRIFSILVLVVPVFDSFLNQVFHFLPILKGSYSIFKQQNHLILKYNVFIYSSILIKQTQFNIFIRF